MSFIAHQAKQETVARSEIKNGHLDDHYYLSYYF